MALQNKAAARQRGVRKARQMAWRRIDGPEASDDIDNGTKEGKGGEVALV